MAIRVSLALLLFLATLPLSAQTTAAPAPNANNVQASAQTLLGQGWGVDHVGIAVHDLTQAQHDYEQLGFKVGKGGHFPGGVFNSGISFQNNSALEVLTVRGTPTGMAMELADFLKKREGAMFLAIDVSSAKTAAEYLKARNFAVQGPIPGSVMKEGETTPPPAQYYTVGPDEPKAGQRGMLMPIAFIEWVSSERREKRRAAGEMDHPNTAVGLHAVWFAVHDAEAQLNMFRDAGLEAGESREVKFLSAHGREVKAGQGVLLILESSNKDGPLAKYLSDRVGPQGKCNCPDDEGVIGLSIEVADLGKARQLAESGTGKKLETYKGFYGTSFLLPPEVTHGVWIEMFQVER